MSDFFNNLPPGFNAPYGPYTTGGAGNPANHGFAPRSSPSTGNPMVDMILPMAMQAFTGKTPEFSRPQTSDHAYTVMQERMRVSKLMHPSVIASNPELKGLGKAGQNSIIQMGMDSIADGGSRVDAFNTIFGNFSSNLAGPGIKNMDENAIASENILKNFDVAFTDENGKFDFDKTSGFNRAETFKNIAAYDKQFGGFSGSYKHKTEADKNKEYLDIAKDVMDRPAIPRPIKGIDSTQKEIDEGRNKLREAEENLSKSQQPDLTPSLDVLKSLQSKQTDPSAKENIESVINEANNLNNTKGSTEQITKEVVEKIENKETNNKESSQGDSDSKITGDFVFEEISKKFEESSKSQSNETPDSSTVAAKIEAVVSKLGSAEDKLNLEKAKETQAANSAAQSEQAKQQSLDLIKEYGNIEDFKKVTEIQDGTGTGLGSLAEQPNARNQKEQQSQIQKIQEVNKMTREGQNVFGTDMPLDEVMENIKGLTEGMGDVETPDVTGLLQKIQATAVVVDMSNDALVKYFDVMKNMYKGMGIKGPSSTEMAQNALLSAKATVDARKERAQRDGKMYTGPSAEEEAQKIAQLQAGVMRSGTQSNVMGYLDTLSDEGTQGEVKKRMQEKVNEGDIAGAQQIAREAVKSGEIDKQTQAKAFRSGQYIRDKGASKDLQERINSGLSEEGRAALSGDIDTVNKMVKANIADQLNRGSTGSSARGIFTDGSAEEKVQDFVNNELTEGDLKSGTALKEKLQKKFGIDSKQAENLSKSIQADFDQRISDEQKLALTNPERDTKRKELQKEQKEIQKEVETVSKERSGELRSMNLGAETLAGIKTVFKKLQDSAKDGVQVTAEDVAKEQGKDWDKMSEKEKNAFKASVDLADSDINKRETETTKQYKKIEEESKKKAVKETEEWSKKYGLTEEQKKQRVIEKTEEFTNKAVKEAGIDGSSLEKGEEEKNKSFDPKEAVDRISRLLESIATKLGVDTNKNHVDTSMNAKTENNGGWWPF
jgi:hypothetical protein